MPRKARSNSSSSFSDVCPSVPQRIGSPVGVPRPNFFRRHSVSCAEPMFKAGRLADFALSFLAEENINCEASHTDEDDDALSTSLTNLEWLSLLASEQSHPSESSDWLTDHSIKPPFSYASLIAKAILSAADRKRTLSEIYDYVTDNFPYYQNSELTAWRNCIRQNLSINKALVRLKGPGADDTAEGAKGSRSSYWTIDESALVDFSPDGVYKKKPPKPAPPVVQPSRKRRNSTKSCSESPACPVPSVRDRAMPSPAPLEHPPTPPIPTPKMSPPVAHGPRSLTPACVPSRLNRQASVGAPYPRTVLRSQSMCSLNSEASATWTPTAQVKTEQPAENAPPAVRSATPPIAMPARQAPHGVQQEQPLPQQWSQHHHRVEMVQGSQHPQHSLHFAPSSAPSMAHMVSGAHCSVQQSWSPMHMPATRTFSAAEFAALPPTPAVPVDDLPRHEALERQLSTHSCSTVHLSNDVAFYPTPEKLGDHDMDELLDIALSQEHGPLHSSLSSQSLFDGFNGLSIGPVNSLSFEGSDVRMPHPHASLTKQHEPLYGESLPSAWDCPAGALLSDDFVLVEELLGDPMMFPHDDLLHAGTAVHYEARIPEDFPVAAPSPAPQTAEPRYRVRKTFKRLGSGMNVGSRGPITLQIDGSHPFTRSIGSQSGMIGSVSEGFNKRSTSCEPTVGKGCLEAVDSGLAASP